jgi:hypothetical protein
VKAKKREKEKGDQKGGKVEEDEERVKRGGWR